MERKHRLSSLLSIVIIVIVLALIGKNMKVTAFITNNFTVRSKLVIIQIFQPAPGYL